MKAALTVLILGIFLFVTGIYTINTINPLNTDKINALIEERGILKNQKEEFENLVQSILSGPNVSAFLSASFATVVLIITVSCGLIFGGLHLVIDKLFFKKFFEPPLYVSAIRRSIMVVTGMLGYFYIKIMYLNPAFFFILLLAFLIIELLVINGKRGTKEESEQVKLQVIS